MRKRQVYAIIGLQFGSEAKGALAGYLARKRQPDTAIVNWSPNAGHTFIDAYRNKYVHSMLPLSIVSPKIQTILIGPGAVVNIDQLRAECHLHRHKFEFNGCRIIIHPNAAVVADRHREAEKEFARIGSTMKGSAEAAIDRMRRDPGRTEVVVAKDVRIWHDFPTFISVSSVDYDSALAKAEVIAIEGCQGYGLSMYHGFYPYTTSRDSSTAQLIADTGIPFGWARTMEVIGCIRTYPIRVANRAEGTSGPCYSDQREISFEDLGVEPEFTTVTKLKRRIFTFSMNQVKEACWRNGVNRLFLTFCDYMDKDYLEGLVASIEQNTEVPIRWFNYGPRFEDLRPIPPKYDVLQEEDGFCD